MKIKYIREAPLLRAYLLINQEKNKKVFKSIQPEISKMSEIFGNDFDRNLHLTLFNDIDFKDLKGLQKSKDRKIQYFLQDFPQYIEKKEFVEDFGQILMHTKNSGSAMEIFNGLNKQCKLSIENQIKLILSFFMSDTEKYKEEAKNILLEKCNDVYKEKKLINLNDEIVGDLLSILEELRNEEAEKENGENSDNSKVKEIEEYWQYFMNYEEELNSCQTSADDIKQISDLDKILDTGNEDPSEIEKLFEDLGPFIIDNRININSDIITQEIEVERLGSFIIYMINHPSIKFNEELKEVNRIFLESLVKPNTPNLNSNSNINYEECKKLLENNTNKELTWDFESIYKLFKKNIDNMDTNQILNSLDNPLFCIKDKKKFEFLIEILHKLNIIKEDNEANKDKFFKNLIFTKWNNEINQIEFIDFMINNEDINENSYYGLNKYNGNRLSEDIDSKVLEQYNNSNTNHQYLINNWKNLDLIEILLQLSKGEFYNLVREIFKWPLQNIPEIISLVLVSVTPENDEFLYGELIYEVISKLLLNKNQNQELIAEIWNLNKNLIIFVVSKIWERKPYLSNLATIFETINLKLPETLPIFVNSKYYDFSVNLAIYAAKKENLNLNQWLEERITKADDEFIESILNYLQKNIIIPCTGCSGSTTNGILEKAQLTSESLAAIIENVIKAIQTNKLSQKIKNYFQVIYKNIFEYFEELQIQSTNAEEVDKEFFQMLNSMFKGEITVDNVINKLINYNNSQNQKENDKYAAFIYSIFDEIRFFHQYPEKEVKKIAELFGKLINNNVIDGMILTIALKFILEGIKVGKGTVYIFGIIALTQFIGKISHWPNFMNSLIDIQQIKNEKDLYQKLLKQFNDSKKKEKGINSENSRGEEGESLLENGDKNNDNAAGREYSLDKDDKNISKPYDKLKNKLSGPAKTFDIIPKNNTNENQNQISDEIINKINFIFGTPNKSNLQDKIKELKIIFKEEKIIKWFGQNFINLFITNENIPYFQKYYEIFDQLKNKELHKEIIKSTIKSVLKNATNNCETINSENKSKETLKNLGIWLGEYKISKDRPILAKDLDFKTLILKACENGKLHLVIPFICSVFKYAPSSKVFRVTNPWVNSILSLLAELNGNGAVDQGVKEEIKNLFKILQTDINSLPKTNELEQCHIKANSPFCGRDVDKDFFYKKISELDDYINNLLGTFNSDPNIYQRAYNRKNSTNNNNTNCENYLYNQNDIIKLLAEVMSNSIQELIPDIISKNVKTSIGTAISLVNKDFMFEKDEAKYTSALENTMKMLAMSLSTINSKESLKKNIDNEFNKILGSKNLTKKTIEKIKQQPNPEFLSIGLNYIYNFINNEASKILNENSLVKEVREKRKQNKQNNNIFIDNKHFTEYSKILKVLPEKLHPNEKCISEDELKIYDKFGKLYEKMNAKEDSGKNSFLNTVYRILKEVLDNISKGKGSFRDYDFCMTNIQHVSQKNDTSYDDDDQQLVCLEKIVSESKIVDKDLEKDLARTTLNYAINGIKNGNILLLNIYSYILKGWTTLNSDISKEITETLLKYEDIFIRYKYELYHNFIKKKIIDCEELEKKFIIILNNNGSDLFARNLLRKLITKTRNSCSYYYDDNSNTYYALFSNRSQITSYILDINTNPIINLKPNDQSNYRKLNSLFLEQVQKYLKNEENPNIINEMRKDMKNFIKFETITEHYLCKIILLICELCIKGPIESQKNNAVLCFPNNCALIIYIIFYVKENFDKLKSFNKVIIGIANFFHKDYMKSKKNINQRAYFRLIYNLLYLLNKNSNDEDILDSEYKKINYLYKLLEFLKAISPPIYPGFVMGWLELISCNIFISNFLEPPLYPVHLKKKDKNEKFEKYEKYLSLIIDILNYLDSLKKEIISDYNYIIFIEKLYKFFFLLTNSYPEFVSCYYYQLITSLSGETSNFIQLKNIILSANPRNITIPDIEFGLSNNEEDDKTEDSNSNGESNNNSINSNNNNLHSTVKKTATILFDTGLFLDQKELRGLIDKYINEEKEEYLDYLVKSLDAIEEEKEENQIFNAIIIYLSQSKHKHYLSEKSIKSKEIIFQFYLDLLNKLGENQRDLLINGILNSLRFPCVQTISYSLLLQELFYDIKNDEIKEHILNNLLQRLLYKPLPWGLRYTMINLYKKDKFQKMIKPFVEKYKLNDILQKIVNICKESDLINYVQINF